MKRIGVLTGGGDCPGLNPAIRGCVMRGLDHGFTAVGLEEGWKGLVEGKTVELTADIVDDIVQKGGFENRGMRAIDHIGQGHRADVGIDDGNGIFQRGTVKHRAFRASYKTDHIGFAGAGKGRCKAGGLAECR